MKFFSGELMVSKAIGDVRTESTVELCADCPRRTGGQEQVKAAGLKGILGLKDTVPTHPETITTPLTWVFSDGTDGEFTGGNLEGTGVVKGLNPQTVGVFIENVVTCEGASDGGNLCSALGACPTELQATFDSSKIVAVQEAAQTYTLPWVDLPPVIVEL